MDTSNVIPITAKGNNVEDVEKPFPRLRFAGRSIKDREWAVLNRIPLRHVSILSGDGGIGKSLLSLQLAVATVLGKDWLGNMPEQGPAIYFSAEEDGDELHRRLTDMARHYHVTIDELEERGLIIYSRAGGDAIMGMPIKDGNSIKPTALYDQIYRAAQQFHPKIIILDALADIFGGNENDRAQVRSFITLLRRLAMETRTAVLVVAHPSQQGQMNGKGYSGSTAWHNSPRGRIYCYYPVAKDKDDKHPNDFYVDVMKCQYGPPADGPRLVRYENGVIVPVKVLPTLDSKVRAEKAKDTFLRLLKRYAEDDRPVTEARACSVFADDPAASDFTLKELKKAQAALFAEKKVHVVMKGKSGHAKRWLEAVPMM
jgi:RecA-family ATPase